MQAVVVYAFVSTDVYQAGSSKAADSVDALDGGSSSSSNPEIAQLSQHDDNYQIALYHQQIRQQYARAAGTQVRYTPAAPADQSVAHAGRQIKGRSHARMQISAAKSRACVYVWHLPCSEMTYT